MDECGKSVGTFLVVQWLRLHVANAGGIHSILGWGTRSRVPQLRPETAKQTSKYLREREREGESADCPPRLSDWLEFEMGLPLKVLPEPESAGEA